MITASIITIGDELLIGQVVDTNSAWMAQKLLSAGIPLRRRVAVGDVRSDIINALDEERKHADIILLTGGLGPTSDDITKPVLCDYFAGNMIVHEETRIHIRHLFEVILKRPMIERNLMQAEVPDNCKVIFNSRGTAPGMWFEENGKVFISMPGVPHEMKGMMEEQVIPQLLQHFTFPYLTHRTLLTFGVGESFLSEQLQDFEKSKPAHINLAYLPNFGQVRLRLSSTGKNKDSVDKELDELFLKLQAQVQSFMVTNKDESMEVVLGKLLQSKNKTVCTAESCTGGYIAYLLTSKPGASAFFEGSMISYSYNAKENLLDVVKQDLTEYGAVSEKVVIQMARGALKNVGADYTIAVSGIMGPGGGLPEKPVGTVWIAVGNKEKIVSKKFNLRFDRERNVQITAVNAMNMLREFILEESQSP